MGLSQSLWTGLSSLQSHQSWTDVISNNLGHANTDGFKYSDVGFTDTLYNSLNSGAAESAGRGSINPSQKGTGVTVDSILQTFTQGTPRQTNRTFDCAIDGNGFFVLGGIKNGSNYYSRNGSFYLSAPLSGNPLEQNLQSAEGLIVQGYQATGGVISDTISDITLPSLSTKLDGEATTELKFDGNVDSNVDVLEGNSIQTVAEGTTTGGWISNTASTINVGGVETSQALLDKTTSSPANGSTDLADISFLRSAGNEQDLFGSVPAGYGLDSRSLTIDFTKGSKTYSETFVYGTDGTTLDDLTRWLTGGVGDAGTPETQRIEGGALGTVRTREYTVAGDGYAAPAEQAGGYYSIDDSGNFSLSIASNLGKYNTISNISISTDTTVTNASTGETRNLQTHYNDFFEPNPSYKEDSSGGSAISLTDIYLPSNEADVGTVKETERVNYTLISRDSNGSTWRWFADGDYGSVEEADLNKGTGIIRFGTTSKTGEQQVVDSTTDGGTTYTMDFSALTQLSSPNSANITQDGYPDGELDGYVIDQYGVIDGTYTNGLTQHLAKIAMAVIPNDNGMEQVGNTLWKTSGVSGEPMFNTTENQNVFGTVNSTYLESSNVNMANQMTRLIMSQRGYQLGSKIVTTSDDMLKEAAALKR